MSELTDLIFTRFTEASGVAVAEFHPWNQPTRFVFMHLDDFGLAIRKGLVQNIDSGRGILAGNVEVRGGSEDMERIILIEPLYS